MQELKGRASAKTVEVTRFKGLGEISPTEFKQFIGTDMRIRQVQDRQPDRSEPGS